MEKKKRTEISTLGKFGLIERLAGGSDRFEDAVVIGTDANYTLLSSNMLLEGVDFGLTYFPLRHLGYKAVTAGVSDILAMNGVPRHMSLSLGVSAKLSVEDLDEFYAGVRSACEELGAELAVGDVKASVTGLAIAVSVVGSVAKERIARRGGAQVNDLICITSNLGAAYLGLHLLEREKRALADVANPQPRFEGYEYLLERQLKPRARKDVVDALAADGIVPTAMTDIADGLASDLMQICRASNCGARIYLDRLPIARETYALAEELHIDPVVAALNGGDDYELLFTVPLTMRDGDSDSDSGSGSGSGSGMQERLSRLGVGIDRAS